MCNKNNVYFSSLKTAVTTLYCLKTTRAHVGESLLLLDSLHHNHLSSRPWLLFFCPTVHLSKQFTAVRHTQTLCRLSEREKHHLTFFPPRVDTQMTHFRGLFKLCAAWREVAQDINTERRTNTKAVYPFTLKLGWNIFCFICHKCFADSVTLPVGVTVLRHIQPSLAGLLFLEADS